MTFMPNNQTVPTNNVNDHLLISRVYELSCEGGHDNPELEALDAILHQRLRQTYGDDSTAAVTPPTCGPD